MAKHTNTEDWVKSFRSQVSIKTNNKFKVVNSRGKIRLQYRHNGINQSVMLQYDWKEDNYIDAVNRIRQVFNNFENAKGIKSLTKAANVVEASSSKHELDLNKLFEEFRGSVVLNASDKTWNKSYVPVLNKAQELLERSKGKPQDGTDLMRLSLTQWEVGSRSRQIARRSLTKFLNWVVLRGKLPASYAPPASNPEPRKPKEIGYPFSDSQILSIIENEPDEKWRFAYQLLAVYGLRPEELRYLRIIDGVKGKELHCTYRKSKGGLKGDKTLPRKLHPLLVKDIDGKPIDWKLQERLEIGEQLPSLGTEGKGGEAIRTHLKREYKSERKNIYLEIREEAKKIDQVAKPYSFRHRYAKQSHADKIPMANIAEAMGHTPDVHLQNYARFMPDSTGEIYSKANAMA
tara:strand:+ start:67 stop:1275 length:1209 start_codon:yes stop_codon:yes gene_type:complete